MTKPEARDTGVTRKKASDAGTASPPVRRQMGRPSPNSKAAVGPEALLDMACRMLEESPPAKVTRASLARYANVDPGLIRYYFKDRDTLIRQAAIRLTDTLRQRRAALVSASELTPADQVVAAAKSLLGFSMDNPFYHRLMLEEIGVSEDAATRQFFKDLNVSQKQRYEHCMAAGVANGSLRDVEPAFVYMAVIGMVEIFVSGNPILEALGFDTDDREALKARYTEFLTTFLKTGLSRHA